MGMPLAVPRYTAEEVRHFPDDRLRYEVIRGELFVTPAPGTAHQRAVRELCSALHAYVVEHGLGEALPAPFEVEFAEDSAVQPDVLVTLESPGEQLTLKRLYGPPALVVEVVAAKTTVVSSTGRSGILDRRYRRASRRALASGRHEPRHRHPDPRLAAGRVRPAPEHRSGEAVSRGVGETGARPRLA